eukprot:Gregarina_sp_Poly_1__10269@NODE_71_length_16098_cov_96_674880_g61_i0_p2_GENE_NODE_71_length_16098_cov_96_674880_g61_i0NODE_71_length_16098_cov_96_674880_g61_i0_p2_ORF_typecomplete_len1255_score244_08MMS19_N/PF14500_6/6e02MMS19_N/PF14500_6/5_2e12_NODE_71_length_16098_cov_96_674880_g61_i033407104
MIDSDLTKIIASIRNNQETEEKDQCLRNIVRCLTADDADERLQHWDTLQEFLTSQIFSERFALTRRAGVTLVTELIRLHCFEIDHDPRTVQEFALLLANQMNDWHCVSAGLIKILLTLLKKAPLMRQLPEVKVPSWLRNPWRDSITYKTRSSNSVDKVIDVSELMEKAAEEVLEASNQDKFLSSTVVPTEDSTAPLPVLLVSSVFVFVSGPSYSPILRSEIYDLILTVVSNYPEAVERFLGPRFISEAIFQMTDEVNPVNLAKCFQLVTTMRHLIPNCFVEETPQPSIPSYPRDTAEATASTEQKSPNGGPESSIHSEGRTNWRHAQLISNFLFSVMPFAGSKISRSIEDSTDVTYGDLLTALCDTWMSWEARLFPVLIDVVFDQFVTISEQLENLDAQQQFLKGQLTELTKITMVVCHKIRDSKSFQYIVVPLVELAKLCLWTARPTSVLFAVFQTLVKSVFKSLSYHLHDSNNRQWIPIYSRLLETQPAGDDSEISNQFSSTNPDNEGDANKSIPGNQLSLAVDLETNPEGNMSVKETASDSPPAETPQEVTDVRHRTAETRPEVLIAMKTRDAISEAPDFEPESSGHVDEDAAADSAAVGNSSLLDLQEEDVGSCDNAENADLSNGLPLGNKATEAAQKPGITETDALCRDVFILTASLPELMKSHHHAILPPHPRSASWLTVTEIMSAISRSSPLGSVAALNAGVKFFFNLLESELDLPGISDEVLISRIGILQTLIWNFLVKTAAVKCMTSSSLGLPEEILQKNSRLLFDSVDWSKLKFAKTLQESEAMSSLRKSLQLWNDYINQRPSANKETFFRLPFETMFVTFGLFQNIDSTWVKDALQNISDPRTTIFDFQPENFFYWISRTDDLYRMFLDHTRNKLLPQENEKVSQCSTGNAGWASVIMMLIFARYGDVKSTAVSFERSLYELEAALHPHRLFQTHEPNLFKEQEKSILQSLEANRTPLTQWDLEAKNTLIENIFPELEQLEKPESAEPMSTQTDPEADLASNLRDAARNEADIAGLINQHGWVKLLETYLEMMFVADFGQIKIPYALDKSATNCEPLGAQLKKLILSQAESAEDKSLIELDVHPPAHIQNPRSPKTLFFSWLLFLEGLKERIRNAKGVASLEDKETAARELDRFLDFCDSHSWSSWDTMMIMRGLMSVAETASFILHSAPPASLTAPVSPIAAQVQAQAVFIEQELRPILRKMEFLGRKLSSHKSRIIRDLNSLLICTLKGVQSEVANMYAKT